MNRSLLRRIHRFAAFACWAIPLIALLAGFQRTDPPRPTPLAVALRAGVHRLVATAHHLTGAGSDPMPNGLAALRAADGPADCG